MPGLVPPQNLSFASPERGDQFFTLFTRCMEGYRTFAHDYLVWGRMEKPLKLRIPQRELPWRTGGGQQQVLTVPAVSHSAWTLEDGRGAVVFVNPELQAHTLEVDLTPIVSAGRQSTIREISTQGGERQHAAPRVQLQIPPLEMLMLEVPAPGQ
jgi:hypothetical protein